MVLPRVRRPISVVYCWFRRVLGRFEAILSRFRLLLPYMGGTPAGLGGRSWSILWYMRAY